MYKEPVPVKTTKINDLKKLLPYVKPQNHTMYDELISKHEEEEKRKRIDAATRKKAGKDNAEVDNEKELAENDSEYEMLSVEEFYSGNSSEDESTYIIIFISVIRL